MPKGTRVDRCYQNLNSSKGKGSAAAICQSSTGGRPHARANAERTANFCVATVQGAMLMGKVDRSS